VYVYDWAFASSTPAVASVAMKIFLNVAKEVCHETFSLVTVRHGSWAMQLSP
jgi:hypothetical protein